MRAVRGSFVASIYLAHEERHKSSAGEAESTFQNAQRQVLEIAEHFLWHVVSHAAQDNALLSLFRRLLRLSNAKRVQRHPWGAGWWKTSMEELLGTLEVCVS